MSGMAQALHGVGTMAHTKHLASVGRDRIRNAGLGSGLPTASRAKDLGIPEGAVARGRDLDRQQLDCRGTVTSRSDC